MTETTPRAASAALYRAVWRWHFIAGLVILAKLPRPGFTGTLAKAS